MDLESLSNEELMAVAGPPLPDGTTDLGTIGLSDDMPDMESLSNEELMQLAGPPEPSTWDIIRNEGLSIANKGVEGVADLASLVQDINPLQANGPRLFGLNPLYNQPDAATGIKDAARAVALYGDEKAETPAGRIAGQVAYFAPGAAIPGGGLAGRVAATVGGGVASGVTREVTDSPTADLVASLLGGLAPGAAASLGRSVFRAVKAGTPRAAAARALEDAAGDEIRAMRPPTNPVEGTSGAAASTFDPFYSQRTLAEELQSPKLAQLQDQVAKRSRTANEALVANEEARRAVQELAVDAVSPQGARTAEGAGAELRRMIQGGSDHVLGEGGLAQEQFGQVAQEALVPIREARRSFSETLAAEYQAGGAPRDLSQIAEEIRRPVQMGDVQGVPNVRPFSYVQDLRDRLQLSWLNHRAAGDAKAARVAQSMMGELDGAINSAPRSGVAAGMTAADVGSYRLGNQIYSEGSRTFREGQVGETMKRSPHGGYSLNDSSVSRTLFNGTPEATRQLLRALPPGQGAVNNARGAVRDILLRQATDNDGNLSANGFRKWLRTNREALTVEEGGRRLFDPEHLDALEQVADDLGLVSSTSERSVKNLANRASKGQPTTAQGLITEYANRLVGTDVPVVRSITQQWQAARDQILSRALIEDKSFAQLLVRPNSERNMAAASRWLATGASATASETSRQSAPEPRGLPRPESREEQSQKRAAGLSPSLKSPPPSSTNQPVIVQALNSLKSGSTMTDNKTEKRPVAAIEQEIDSDPYYSALYEAESGRNPKARPIDPKTGKLLSSAKGGFQFLDGTAKLVKLKDPDDLEEAFEKVKYLTEDHKKRFGDDPEFLYSAHYLGATVLNKVINGKPLTRKEQEQVDYLKEKALPRFLKIYSKVAKRNKQVGA